MLNCILLVRALHSSRNSKIWRDGWQRLVVVLLKRQLLEIFKSEKAADLSWRITALTIIKEDGIAICQKNIWSDIVEIIDMIGIFFPLAFTFQGITHIPLCFDNRDRLTITPFLHLITTFPPPFLS